MQKQFLFPIIATVISVILTLVSFEAVARLFAPAWLMQRMLFLNPPQSEQVFGSDRSWKIDWKNGRFWRFSPHSTFYITHLEYNNEASIDEFGGRVTMMNRSDNEEVIPFVGDSFTFGLGVADSETFASLISLSITSKRILNLGVPGTALDQQLNILEARHDELGRPRKYVFFFFLGNDFSDLVLAKQKQDNASQSERKGRKSSDSMVRIVNAFVVASPVLRRSYLLQFVRRYALLVINWRNPAQYIDPIFAVMNRENRPYLDAAAGALREQFNRLSHLEARIGFDALLVAIPSIYQVSPRLRHLKETEYNVSERVIDPMLPNRILSDSAKELRMKLIDATDCIAEEHNNVSFYYTQDPHFTAKGHKAFAECIRTGIMSFLGASH